MPARARRERRSLDPAAFAARAVRRALYLPLLLTAAFAAAVLLQVASMRASMSEVEHATRAISSMRNGYRLLVDCEAGLRGYLLTGDSAFLQRTATAQAELPAAVDAVERDAPREPQATAAARELRVAAERWGAYERRVLAVHQAGGDLVTAQAEGKALMDSLRRDIEARIEALRLVRDRRGARARSSAEWTLAGVAGVALVLGAAIAAWVRRDLLAVKRAFDATLLESAEARDEAEEASRLKDEFLGTISHELRTPLNAILGWTALLRRRPEDPETRARAVDTIDRNARAQAHLVDDMLDVSRIVTGELAIRVGPIDFGAAVAGAVDALRPAAQARHLGVEVDVPPSVRPMRGDRARLQQVVWNLVSNAVKFTPAGGRVLVSARRQGDAIELRVSDSGPGIPEDLLPHLFERFRQGDSSPTRRHGGLGLGLAIVRHLVELHGGTVRAESPGDLGGATIVVRLPAGDELRDHSLTVSVH